MTVCNTCTLNLYDTRKALAEEPETRARIDGILAEIGITYVPDVEITHFLWVLLERVGAERLHALVTRPLAGLKVAAFYGCHLIRPKHHYGFSDSREAHMIEDLAEILGCESVDYSGRTEY
jgi:succinate dehydrogenase / fumarate reductase cytochrome b subunit